MSADPPVCPECNHRPSERHGPRQWNHSGCQCPCHDRADRVLEMQPYEAHPGHRRVDRTEAQLQARVLELKAEHKRFEDDAIEKYLALEGRAAKLRAQRDQLAEALRFVQDKCTLYGPADRARELIEQALRAAHTERHDHCGSWCEVQRGHSGDQV